MALSAADVGELRRQIQSNELLGKAGGIKICRQLLGEFKRLVKPGNMTPGEARVYALTQAYDRLQEKSLYGGHNKMYIDAQLEILQSIMEEAETV